MLGGRALDPESETWLLVLEGWLGWPGLTYTCFSGILYPNSQGGLCGKKMWLLGHQL